jgi:hypothetical protein
MERGHPVVGASARAVRVVPPPARMASLCRARHQGRQRHPRPCERRGLPAARLMRLRNSLLIIVNYVERGKGGPASRAAAGWVHVKGRAAKQAFILLSRTDFASMCSALRIAWDFPAMGSRAQSRSWCRAIRSGEASHIASASIGPRPAAAAAQGVCARRQRGGACQTVRRSFHGELDPQRIGVVNI